MVAFCVENSAGNDVVSLDTHTSASHCVMTLAEFIADPQAVVNQVKSLLSQPGPSLEQVSA